MLKIATEIIDIFYPVGSIYSTTDSTYNPNTKMGGTWEQITDDAYLKIVSSNAGTLDGTSSEHKIPIESMPSHKHDSNARINWYNTTATGMGVSWISNGNMCVDREATTTSSVGGGQAYYPYYYGIYVWHRIA